MPKICWICGTEMVPDEDEAYLICPNQKEHPKDRPKGVVKVKLPDANYP